MSTTVTGQSKGVPTAFTSSIEVAGSGRGAGAEERHASYHFHNGALKFLILLYGRSSAGRVSRATTEGDSMGKSDTQAVVVGSGMAGLLAARVLSEFYAAVTVVERDRLPDHPAQRKGVPQGRHLHHLLSRGVQAIDELFPRLVDELAAAGATVIADGDLSRTHAQVGGYMMNRTGKFADPKPLRLCQASRPFVEFHVRRRVTTLDNVTILDRHDADDLLGTADAVSVLRTVNRSTGERAVLEAGLVVDATGRATRTPAYLEKHGFDAAPEDRVGPTGGYSSQLLRMTDPRITERVVFIDRGRKEPAGVLLASEHDTWMLAIADHANTMRLPTTFDDVIAAAERIFPTQIMAGLRDARPVGDVAVSRNTAALWRRYDRMPRFPAGLVVIGDALCYLNPFHGQGITMAVMQAQALRDCLRIGDSDLSRRYFDATAERIEPTWAMNHALAIGVANGSSRSVRHRLHELIRNATVKAAARDITVTEQLLRIRNLIDPPARLQNPALLSRILLAGLRRPPRHSLAANASQPA